MDNRKCCKFTFGSV